MISNSRLQSVAVGLVLILASLGVGLSGSDAFGVTATDRSMTLGVVDDDTAYVGYDSPDRLDVNVTTGVDETLVTVTNRFSSPIRVTDVETDSRLDVSLPSELGVGETGSIHLIDCDVSLDDEPVHVTVFVDGVDVEATVFGETATRTVVLDCHE
jgi:hypothetical protein